MIFFVKLKWFSYAITTFYFSNQFTLRIILVNHELQILKSFFPTCYFCKSGKKHCNVIACMALFERSIFFKHLYYNILKQSFCAEFLYLGPLHHLHRFCCVLTFITVFSGFHLVRLIHISIWLVLHYFVLFFPFSCYSNIS